MGRQVCGAPRSIRYLRVSLTDRCNFRCVYCMPPPGIPKIDHAEILRFHEVLAIVRLMADRFGVTKVRVTGGEPLVRRGACALLTELCQIPGLSDVTLTTNGSLLEPMAPAIRGAGVKRINVSLDTLRRDRFLAITRCDGLDRTLRGIEAALACGFRPVKINTVVLQENLDEIPDLIDFAQRTGVEIRFIERMPYGAPGRSIPNDEVLRAIKRRHRLSSLQGDGEAGSTSVRYRIDDG